MDIELLVIAHLLKTSVFTYLTQYDNWVVYKPSTLDKTLSIPSVSKAIYLTHTPIHYDVVLAVHAVITSNDSDNNKRKGSIDNSTLVKRQSLKVSSYHKSEFYDHHSDSTLLMITGKRMHTNINISTNLATKTRKLNDGKCTAIIIGMTTPKTTDHTL